MANKILKKNKIDGKKQRAIDEFKEILSIDTMLTVLSFFYIGCSALVVVIKSFAKEYFWLLVGIMGIVVFILLWIIFQWLALRQRRKKAKQARVDDAKNIAEQLEYCRDCSLKKINNGMGFRKLFLASEIKQIESKLDQDVDPSKASVLVYTSDLSTILRRLDVIKANINKKINYRVIYFKNTIGARFEEIKLLLKDNLIYALDIKELKDSLDSEMMLFNDMEVIIFLDSTRRFIQSFFSIDHVGINSTEVGRNTHDSECKERCNYGKDRQEPTYKALNDEKARMLFNDIESLTKGGELHE